MSGCYALSDSSRSWNHVRGDRAEIMHLCIVHTCRNLLFIERMKTHPMQLYPPNISCVGFCSALTMRKSISPPGYKYLEKKLLLVVDYVITLHSVDERNAYVHRAWIAAYIYDDWHVVRDRIFSKRDTSVDNTAVMIIMSLTVSRQLLSSMFMRLLLSR